MAEKLTCDTCSTELKRGHMVTVDVTYHATSHTDPTHEELHFCDKVCLGWWGKEQGDEWGWFGRPRPAFRRNDNG